MGKSAFTPSTGTSVPGSYANNAKATLAVVHGSGNWGLAVTRAADDNLHANLLLYKTRNAIASMLSPLMAGDKIGRIVWQGPDAANTLRDWAEIESIATDVSNRKGMLRFTVLNNNVTSSMSFQDGNLSIPVLSITGGSDLSEQFEINEAKSVSSHHVATSIQAGMIVSIDSANPGELVISNQAYDRRVAGIISGAGGVKTGMMMGQSGSIADGQYPVALTGRVYCWADATNGTIKPGDLMTTSNIPGYAMKVTDHTKARGAIIGKAMTGLKQGQGLVLVLVALQ